MTEEESTEEDHGIEVNELYEFTGLLDYPAGVYEVKRIEGNTVRLQRVRDGNGDKVAGGIQNVGVDDFPEKFEEYDSRET